MTMSMDDKQLAATSPRSQTVNRFVSASVDRNRWYFVTVFLSLVICGLGWGYYNLSKLAQVNRQIVWVKLSPDGTAQVTDFKPSDNQLFYTATVNSLLERFLKSRYGLQPETVKEDYKVADVFLSDPLHLEFVGAQPGQFNAAQKVTDVTANPKAFDRVDIKWSFVDHYDAIDGLFDGKESKVVRSNVYFQRSTRLYGGQPKGPPERMIARLQWRLVPAETLRAAGNDWLRTNPIGLEIVSYDVIPDPAGAPVSTSKDKAR